MNRYKSQREKDAKFLQETARIIVELNNWVSYKLNEVAYRLANDYYTDNSSELELYRKLLVDGFQQAGPAGSRNINHREWQGGGARPRVPEGTWAIT